MASKRIPTYKRYEHMSPELWEHVLRCIFCGYVTDGPLAGMYELCDEAVTLNVFDVVGFGSLDFEHGASLAALDEHDRDGDE